MRRRLLSDARKRTEGRKYDQLSARANKRDRVKGTMWAAKTEGKRLGRGTRTEGTRGDEGGDGENGGGASEQKENIARRVPASFGFSDFPIHARALIH